MQKTINNFDAAGLYVGSSYADPSPCEPGVFLIPAMATDVKLTTYDPAIERCRFNGAAWVVEGIPVPDEPAASDIPEPTPTQIILAQIAALESSVNDRRIREAVLNIDGGWLKALNDQVSALRAQLVSKQ